MERRSFDSAATPADRGRAHMFAADRASQGARHARSSPSAPGTATLTMTVRDDMLNGFDICHGGFITTLADSAFAFACNSRNEVTVAAGLTVDFLAPGARAATCSPPTRVEVARAGRTGVYDIVVTNQRGERVALVRGRSHSSSGRTVVPVAAAEGDRDDIASDPSPGELEPIERASRDELQALQLERLRWTLQHAYDNVAALPEARSTPRASIPST